MFEPDRPAAIRQSHTREAILEVQAILHRTGSIGFGESVSI